MVSPPFDYMTSIVILATFAKWLRFNVLLNRTCDHPSGFTDKDYEDAGAKIVHSVEELYEISEIICKVKEPQPQERPAEAYQPVGPDAEAQPPLGVEAVGKATRAKGNWSLEAAGGGSGGSVRSCESV